MNIPKRASRHHAMRASFCVAVSPTGPCATRRAVVAAVKSRARTNVRSRTGISWWGGKSGGTRQGRRTPARTKLHGGEATVDRKRDAGDERRLVGDQPERGVSALLGAAEPADALRRLVRAPRGIGIGTRVRSEE